MPHRVCGHNVPIRIGLNLLHARPEIGGGWNYISNIVSSLRLCNEQCRFVAYCTDISAELVPREEWFEKRTVHLGTRRQVARILYEQTVLDALARRDSLDCMHHFAGNVSLFGSVPQVVTLHDFLFLERASDVPFIRRLYL